MPRPERRHRGDLIAVALLGVLAAVGAVLVVTTGAAAGTTSRPAAEPIATPPAAIAAPDAFTEAWRAPDTSGTGPVLAGPAVVTADGGTVTGRDARTGEVRWTYARDRTLCALGSGFPRSGDGERAVALHATGSGEWCSELMTLSGATGERLEGRNTDARPGVRLLADDTYVLAADPGHLEAWRSDLVRTVEYGDVPAQEQPNRQPRPGCTYGSTALADKRVGVVERCPDGTRLTVLVTDGKDGSESPEERFSVPLADPDAVVVAVTEDRTAVALPGRLAVFDGRGAQIAVTELEHGGIAPTTTDGRFTFWWTGTSVVALDATELAPVWTFPGALGPAVRYGTDLLVPVPGGLQVVDERGEARRLIPVERADPDAPVVPGVLGNVLLERRGPEIVALTS